MIYITEVVDVNGSEVADMVVTRTDIENTIKKLLELAYGEIEGNNVRYIGYPTCDIIACFLDAKEMMGSRFFDIFNEIVSEEYKNNWELFQKNLIEPKLYDIVQSFLNLEDAKVEINLDSFPHRGMVSNFGLASMLLMIYGSYGETWIEENEKYLVKSTKLLINNRIPEGGWPYHNVEEKEQSLPQTLATWLSMAALVYVPKKIGNKIINGGWDSELKKIKIEVKKWLIESMDQKDGYCSCSFIPGRQGVKRNPIATAQAILALYHTGVTTEEENDIIERAIKYIKSNKDDMFDEWPYKKERLPQRIGQIESTFHPGIQQCLQALLIFDISPEDKTVQNLLSELIKIVPKLKKDDDVDMSVCYATIRPLLLVLSFARQMPLLNSSASIGEFESFVSGAKSIAIIGEMDDAHAKLIPDDAQVTVLCRAPHEKTLLETYGWDYTQIESAKVHALGTLNCVIVDGEKVLLSRDPFKDMGIYNFHKYLKGDEVSILIEQLENITNIEIPINGGDIKQEILDKLSAFPKHCKIIGSELENMETEGLKGILEYVRLNPKYAEGAELASALGLEDRGRESVERELSEKGVFSRIFVNSKLEDLMKHSMSDDNDNPLVLDESSAYLILNCGDNKEEILKKCLAGIEEFYVTSDIYDMIKAHLEPAQHRILKKIEDKDNKYVDAFESLQEALPNYHFNENEKIEIGFIITEGEGEMGIITNSCEVAKACKENNIRTFSLMKFLNEDEDTYKLFRIPVDKIAG